MRLRDLHHYLGAYSALNFTGGEKATPTLRAALEQLSLVPSLRTAALELLTGKLLSGGGVMAFVDVHRFQAGVDTLRTRAQLLHETISGVLPPQDPQSLCIRIPRPENLDELKAIIFELQHVFEEPVKAILGSAKADIEFQAFDVGTEWIELLVRAPEALAFIVGLLKAATWYQKEALEIARRRTELETTIGATAAVLQYADLDRQLLEAKRERLSKDLVAHHVAGTYMQRTESELQNLVDRGILRWAGLMGRGATVIPAFNAAKEVREGFPSLDHPPTFAELETKLLGPARTSITDANADAPDLTGALSAESNGTVEPAEPDGANDASHIAKD